MESVSVTSEPRVASINRAAQATDWLLVGYFNVYEDNIEKFKEYVRKHFNMELENNSA